MRQLASKNVSLSLFGIPINIQPGFLLFMGLIGYMFAGPGPFNFPRFGLIAAVFFFSILVHEMGHALTARSLGCSGLSVNLIFFGGFATYSPTTSGRSLLITLAGPGATLLLGLAAFGVSRMPQIETVGGEGAMRFFIALFWQLNAFWLILNLLPIYPLDGGQAVFHGLSLKIKPNRAIGIAAKLSIVTCALVGVLAYRFNAVFIVGLCALYAFQNFKTLGQSR